MRKGILRKRILEGQFRKGILEGHFRKGRKGTVHKLEFLQHFFFGKGQMRDPRNANLMNSSIALREELSFRKFDKKAQFCFTKV